MGVSSYLIIFTGEALDNPKFPQSMSIYLKQMLTERTLFGKPVYVGCGMELSEWFWDDIELEKADKVKMIKEILGEDGEDPTGCLPSKEDYDTYEEFIVGCLEEEDSLIAQAYIDYIEEEHKFDCIHMISQWD